MSQKRELLKFSHDLESKYDLETYYGRFFHFQEIINPKYTPIYFLNVFKNLLYSNPALNQYSDILRRHKENKFSLVNRCFDFYSTL